MKKINGIYISGKAKPNQNRNIFFIMWDKENTKRTFRHTSLHEGYL